MMFFVARAALCLPDQLLSLSVQKHLDQRTRPMRHPLPPGDFVAWSDDEGRPAAFC